MAKSLFRGKLTQYNLVFRHINGDNCIQNDALNFLSTILFTKGIQKNISCNIRQPDHILKFEWIISEILENGYIDNPLFEQMVYDMKKSEFERKISFDVVKTTRQEKNHFNNDYKLRISFEREYPGEIKIDFEFIFAAKDVSNLKIFKVVTHLGESTKRTRDFLINNSQSNDNYHRISIHYLQKAWIKNIFNEGYYDYHNAELYFKSLNTNRSELRKMMDILRKNKDIVQGVCILANNNIMNILSKDIGFL